MFWLYSTEARGKSASKALLIETASPLLGQNNQAFLAFAPHSGHHTHRNSKPNFSALIWQLKRNHHVGIRKIKIVLEARNNLGREA